MNRTLISFIFTFFILGLLSINAQESITVEERLAKLQGKLNLTEEQSDSIEVILTNSQEAAMKIREKNEGKKFAMAREFRGLMKETNSQIEELLTEEQKEIYKEMIEEAKENFKARRKNRN